MLKVRQILRSQIEAGEEIALLFSDLREFAAFTASRGDRAAFRLSQLHEGILRARIDEYGIVVKSMGDGIMAAFERPADAVLAAVAIQRAVREENRMGIEEPIDVGIGLSSGTPVMTDIDFIGHAVNLAQRLSAFAKGGQILATEGIHAGAGSLPDVRYIPTGPRRLRGLGQEDVVEVGWLRELARISDARDRVTLILTEEGDVVVEVAKDPKQSVREGLEGLRRARAEEDGFVSALLQRAAGRLVERLLRRTTTADVGREFPLDRVELTYRRGTVRARTPKGELKLDGVTRSDAESFLAETARLGARAARPAA
jgi:class 3 adenylate cyclase